MTDKQLKNALGFNTPPARIPLEKMSDDEAAEILEKIRRSNATRDRTTKFVIKSKDRS